MSAGGKKKHYNLNTVSVKLGCSCTRPRISALFGRRHHSKKRYSSDLGAVQGFGRIDGESVAVEKDSDDPYLDFRRSMLQMIVEKELYSKEDLRQLLNCFLQLNSPYYHGLIIRAFTEIWNSVYSVRSPSQHGSD